MGVILYDIERPVLKVNSLMLSCRVLGRGVEHQMLATLVSGQKHWPVQRLRFYFIPSERNQPAWSFLEAVGKDDIVKNKDNKYFVFSSDSLKSIRFLETKINIKKRL